MNSEEYFNSLGFDPARIAAKQMELAEAWATAKGEALQLRELRKTALAELKNKEKGSDAAKETIALASSIYREHIKEMCKKTTAEHRAELKYKDFCSWVEMKRTAESTKRLRMQLDGRTT